MRLVSRPRARPLRTHAERLVPVAAFEQRDDEAGGEGVARGGPVLDLDARRCGARNLHPVLEQRRAGSSIGDGDELPARDDFVLELVDDQQVRLDVDRACRRGVEREEVGAFCGGEDNFVGRLELREHRAAR